MAAVSINLHAADQSALPAPLPEFMNDEQAAKWTADQAAATPATVSEPSAQFYTGKPYVADAGGYVYKYRTYNPEMSRWTSADPSGFPDGVNNQIYAGVPISGVDSDGLTYTSIESSTMEATSTKYTNGEISYGTPSQDYNAGATADLTTSLTPIPHNGMTSGTANAVGTTELVPISSSGSTQLPSYTSDSWTITMDPSSGAITITENTGGNLTNSNGGLINTSVVTITGNGSQSVQLKWNTAATGTGTVSTFSIITFTAE